jgi:hypothetical protein
LKFKDIHGITQWRQKLTWRGLPQSCFKCQLHGHRVWQCQIAHPWKYQLPITGNLLKEEVSHFYKQHKKFSETRRPWKDILLSQVADSAEAEQQEESLALQTRSSEARATSYFVPWRPFATDSDTW